MRLMATALAVGIMASPVAAQQTGARSTDEAAVRETVQRYMDARNARDPRAIEALFTIDADQHTTSGQWRRGLEQIVPGTLDSSRRNPGMRTITIESVRFVASDVALADGRYEIATDAAGPARTMWTTLVLARDSGGWRIAAIRNMVPTGS